MNKSLNCKIAEEVVCGIYEEQCYMVVTDQLVSWYEAQEFCEQKPPIWPTCRTLKKEGLWWNTLKVVFYSSHSESTLAYL